MPSDDGEIPSLREDEPGRSPPNVSGGREEDFFNKDAASHDERMKRLEMGWLGRAIGVTPHIATHIACLSIFAGIVLCIACLAGAYVTSVSSTADFLKAFAERSLAFSAAALAFVFGRTVK